MAKPSDLEKFAIVVIICAILWILKFICSFLWKFFIGPIFNKVDFRSKGQWALVTGCTDGIGKAYAEELAARGCDIILVSRSPDKLRAVAENIEKTFKVKTHIIVADFTETDGLYEKISREIEGYEIGTLVNNVGISYPYPEYFLDVPEGPSLFDKIIKANIVSVVRLCGIVLPQMLERGRGVIINVGSGASTNPSPLVTVYSASKIFVEKFTLDLNSEYAGKGVIMQCVMPGFVVSNMSKIRHPSFFSPTAKVYVQSALSLVGTLTRTTGYLRHTMLIGTLHWLKWFSEDFVTFLVFRTMKATRLRALKKQKMK